jgi:hypothetical protein
LFMPAHGTQMSSFPSKSATNASKPFSMFSMLATSTLFVVR